MYVKQLSEDEKKALDQRSGKIRELQEKGICFSCHHFKTGEVFDNDDKIFYEDEKVRCLFETYPKVTGHTIIVAMDHYEDISEMPLELGVHILKLSHEIIKLHKEIIGAEKVYLCTICDGKRNHLHFQLLPRLKGDTIGFKNFAREVGVIADYHETVELYKRKLKGLMG